MATVVISAEPVNPSLAALAAAWEPAPNPPGLPLSDWYAAEAAWYSQLETETAELVASVLTDLAESATGLHAATPRELIGRSATYGRAVLEGLEVPRERRSRLAELLEVDAADYLLLATDAARLAAWAILEVSDAAHALGARNAWEFSTTTARIAIQGD